MQVDGQSTRWLRHGALDGRPVVLLAHGAGAPMDSAFMAAVCAGLVQRGCCVARFQFPFMQRALETGKRRPPDRRPRLLATWRSMLARARAWDGAGPLVLAGKSMGARMASHVLAEGQAPDARAAVYLGFPLHPPGKPGSERAAHLTQVSVPQLFVSGDKDPLARFELLTATTQALGRRGQLHVVHGGDHSLARRRSELPDPGASWLDDVARFVARYAGA
ncbi:MAG: alpha/beta hydrolase [Planctomycetota bacterium]|nr:MAG: alpha/beta hydrolase [Planctomycetota bacterium]